MDPSSEKRQHPRQDVFSAAIVMPNGDRHSADVLNLSAGGARFRLPADWIPRDGSALRLFFQVDAEHAIRLEGHVTRVAIDHLGVQFDPAQDERIRDLLDAFGVRD